QEVFLYGFAYPEGGAASKNYRTFTSSQNSVSDWVSYGSTRLPRQKEKRGTPARQWHGHVVCQRTRSYGHGQAGKHQRLRIPRAAHLCGAETGTSPTDPL